MATKEELDLGVWEFFFEDYEVTNGQVVPDVKDMSLGNNGREMELAMMFVDIRESTKIVNGFRRLTAAKMYKSFLWGVSQIATANGGYLKSFNGDGVLIVFDGGSKRSNAVKAAMQIKWFCTDILKPEVDAYMEKNQKLKDAEFDFGIGIDVGSVLIVRGGMRGDNNNDLVWVGNATNYAVKLSGLGKKPNNIYITEDVYTSLKEDRKTTNDINMWIKSSLVDGTVIYKTNWHWPIS